MEDEEMILDVMVEHVTFLFVDRQEMKESMYSLQFHFESMLVKRELRNFFSMIDTSLEKKAEL